MTVRITIESEHAESARDTVLAGLRSYNRRHAEPPDFQAVTITARDESGTIVAGLVGDTGWRWLHVDLLWVDDAHRGRGIGSRLLAEAEREAIRRKCSHAYLDTFEFQARAFYERLGYVVFGIQDDYPPGSRRYYLRKPLVPEPEARAAVSGATVD